MSYRRSRLPRRQGRGPQTHRRSRQNSSSSSSRRRQRLTAAWAPPAPQPAQSRAACTASRPRTRSMCRRRGGCSGAARAAARLPLRREVLFSHPSFPCSVLAGPAPCESSATGVVASVCCCIVCISTLQAPDVILSAYSVATAVLQAIILARPSIHLLGRDSCQSGCLCSYGARGDRGGPAAQVGGLPHLGGGGGSVPHCRDAIQDAAAGASCAGRHANHGRERHEPDGRRRRHSSRGRRVAGGLAHHDERRCRCCALPLRLDVAGMYHRGVASAILEVESFATSCTGGRWACLPA